MNRQYWCSLPYTFAGTDQHFEVSLIPTCRNFLEHPCFLFLSKNLSALPQQATALHLNKDCYQPARLTKAGSIHEHRQSKHRCPILILAKSPDPWLPNKTNTRQAVSISQTRDGMALGPWEVALLLTFEIILKWKTHIPEPVAKNNTRQKVLKSS